MSLVRDGLGGGESVNSLGMKKKRTWETLLDDMCDSHNIINFSSIILFPRLFKF